MSRIAGRLLLQYTLAATQCLTIYSTTSSRGYYWPNAYVSNAVPWYFYYHTYVSNAIPWQLVLPYGELTTNESIVRYVAVSVGKATTKYAHVEKSYSGSKTETS